LNCACHDTEGQRTPTAVEEIIEKAENLVVEGMDDRLASSGLWFCLIHFISNKYK